jgi:hypothetical protein
MIARWASLLTSAALAPEDIPPAFPEILRQLEPIEARFLEVVSRYQEQQTHIVASPLSYIDGFTELERLAWRNLDNVERLQTLHYSYHGPMNVRAPVRPYDCQLETTVFLTDLGLALLRACKDHA